MRQALKWKMGLLVVILMVFPNVVMAGTDVNVQMSSGNGDEINVQVRDDAPGESLLRLGVGGRIGGYGFRNVSDAGNLDWMACRMDGVGVFTTLDVGDHFFTELSTDFYHATSDPQKEGIDRVSIHTILAMGFRMFPNWFFSPNVQMGGGVEFSAAEIYGTRTIIIAPTGFIGFGGEFNVGDHLRLGASLRSNLMPLPIYDWETAEGVVNWEYEVAGQALFTARYVF